MKTKNKHIKLSGKILKLMNTRKSFEARGSVADIIKACELIDINFNRAFSSGYGAKFDNNGNLIDVDGFGLFKRLEYQTDVIVNDTLLRVQGSLEEDTFCMSFVKRVDAYRVPCTLTSNWDEFLQYLNIAIKLGYDKIKTLDGYVYEIIFANQETCYVLSLYHEDQK